MAEVHYTPKCYSSGNRGTCEGDSLSLRKILQDYPGKVLKCQCQRASCELKQLLREENRRPQREPKWITLEEGLKEELIRVVGGSAAYQNVYDYCQKLSLAEPQVFSRMASSQGDTVLMELCVDKKIEWRLLTAQALAFISLYEEHCPSFSLCGTPRTFARLSSRPSRTKGNSHPIWPPPTSRTPRTQPAGSPGPHGSPQASAQRRRLHRHPFRAPIPPGCRAQTGPPTGHCERRGKDPLRRGHGLQRPLCTRLLRELH
ncbi:Putative LOC100679080 [Caligus rogercresseyi]|uniref:LOC100679080 n=1 Tax=Caligus rogercresseyi TaxID=217165 RepID=A0A7T8KC61_CALRO|nr:Putative LOC100679080 [Caligus rogercresseyi]